MLRSLLLERQRERAENEGEIEVKSRLVSVHMLFNNGPRNIFNLTWA